MNQKFSQKIRDVLSYSREEAIRLGSSAISSDHLFLGILRDGEGEAINILLAEGVNLSELKKELDVHLLQIPSKAEEINVSSEIAIYKSERALKIVILEARALKSESINTAHLMLAILKDDTNYVANFLKEKDIDYGLGKI